jgi:hypothetical protein
MPLFGIGQRKPGNLDMHWPEGMGLLSGAAFDPDSMEPDDNLSAQRKGVVPLFPVTKEKKGVRPLFGQRSS